MSYILDALRRADAERERGAVPSLHSQQHGALPGDDDESAKPPRLLFTIIAALVLALGSALAWNYWGGGDTSRRAAAQGTVAPAPSPSPPIAAAPMPATPMPVPAAAPPAATPPIAAASPSPTTAPTIAPAPSPKNDSHRRLDEAAAQLTAPNRHRAGRADSAATSASTAGSAKGKLPEALRRELPALAFGGASYSSDPASRMVIFNGRVFHEGDTIAPLLVLQQIKLKAAIFTYKGFVYEIEF